MGKLVLILGGARSGKSAMAETLARRAPGRVTYIATAEARDDEMRRRIERHQSERPAEWTTVEEPLDLAGTVRGVAPESDVVLIDCLTLWLSNHLCTVDLEESGPAREAAESGLVALIEDTSAAIVEAARTSDATLLVVSNEVGLGLVPATTLGRVYRDLLGTINRRLAAKADSVLLMVAGIPIDAKRLAHGTEL